MRLFKRKPKQRPAFWEHYEASFARPLPNAIDAVRFVVLDTETTGLDHHRDRILCIGALVLQNSTIDVGKSFEVYIKQDHYHGQNVEIHGILREERKVCITEIEALERFLVFLDNAVIVAHHAGFDLRMLNQALIRHGLPKLKNKALDTSVLYRRTVLRSPLVENKDHYTLDELADKFDISKKDRHTALGDAYITAIAFLNILNKLKQKSRLTLKYLLK